MKTIELLEDIDKVDVKRFRNIFGVPTVKVIIQYVPKFSMETMTYRSRKSTFSKSEGTPWITLTGIKVVEVPGFMTPFLEKIISSC